MLDRKQQELYLFIRKHILQHGYAPTETEVIKALDLPRSQRTVNRYIQTLVDRGYLSRLSGKKRSLQLTENIVPQRLLTITAQIAAGNPIEPVHSQRVLDLTDLLLGSNRFVLEVVGNSMEGDNICNGDYIICERRGRAKDDEIVVALIKNTEMTLKRIQYNEDGTITLLSSNPSQPPMVHNANEVTIEGVYLGLIRLTEKIAFVKETV